MIVAVATVGAYALVGPGVRFFPEVEPEQAQVQVHARGDLSAVERDRLVAEVEQRILPVDGLKTVYARSGVHFRGEDIDEDVIGIILLEFTDWRARRPAAQILAEIRERTARPRRHLGRGAGGRSRAAGRQAGAARDRRRRPSGSSSRSVDEVRGFFGGLSGPHGRERQPARAGHRMALRGRPRAGRPLRRRHHVGRHAGPAGDQRRAGRRLPARRQRRGDRHPRALQPRRTATSSSSTGCASTRRPAPCRSPISSRWSPLPRTGDIERVDGKRVLTVSADVEPGVLPDEKVREIRAWLEQREFDPAGRVHLPRRGRGAAGGRGLPAHRVRRRLVPDRDHPGAAVQQLLPVAPDPVGGRVLDRGRAPGPAAHRAAVRHRHERRRRDLARRHRGQQQHHPDRHLQRAARARPRAVRGDPAHRRAAAAAGVPHHDHDGPRPRAAGSQAQHRLRQSRGHPRRAVGRLVGRAVHGGRRRPDLRDADHARADARAAAARRPGLRWRRAARREAPSRADGREPVAQPAE